MKFIVINTKGAFGTSQGTTTQGISAQRFNTKEEAQEDAARRNCGGDPDKPEWTETSEMFADPELYPEVA